MTTLETTTERDQHSGVSQNGHLGSRVWFQQNIGRSSLFILAVFGSIVTWQLQTNQNRPVSGLCTTQNRIGSSCHLQGNGLSSAAAKIENLSTIHDSDNNENILSIPMDDGKTKHATTTSLPQPNASIEAPTIVFFNQSSNGVQNIKTVYYDSSTENRHEASYLLYFSESGWANQEICMEHAYYFARALNRTLILPPVLPHLGKGSLSAREVFSMESTHFKTGVDPLKFYVNKLPREKYVPIHHVLDIDFSFADISVMDALDFYSVLTSNSNMTRGVVESNYSHYNTRWISNRSDVEGEVMVLTRQEYGQTVELHMTNRDIVKTFADSTENILVLLDGFKSVFDESSTTPLFQPRMSKPIRTFAQTVRERWHVPAYGSIHIRGGDGWFAEDNKLQETIVVAMNNITQQILAWLENSDAGETTVGLYVATDVSDLFNHTVMAREVRSMLERIQNSSNVVVDILSSDDLSNQSQIMKDIRYSNVFLDLQMAVCATVGFVGTEGSTFSNLIQKHRHKSSC